MKISKKDFENALREVILPSDRVFVVHSALWVFGNQLDIPIDKIPETILEMLLSIAGSNGTLIIPTFTYSVFPRTRFFDHIKTRSQTGVLGEKLLKMPGAFRSMSPMESFAVIGKHAREFAELNGKSEWGDGSTWEWLENVNARTIGLGLPLHKSVSIVHRPEETARVSYRYYKVFKGVWCDGKADQKEWRSVNYVRALPAMMNYFPVEERLFAENLALKPRLSEITIHSALSRDIIKVTLELLKEDEFIFIANKDEMKEWLKNGKEREISSLKPEERYSGE